MRNLGCGTAYAARSVRSSAQAGIARSRPTGPVVASSSRVHARYGAVLVVRSWKAMMFRSRSAMPHFADHRRPRRRAGSGGRCGRRDRERNPRVPARRPVMTVELEVCLQVQGTCMFPTGKRYPICGPTRRHAIRWDPEWGGAAVSRKLVVDVTNRTDEYLLGQNWAAPCPSEVTAVLVVGAVGYVTTSFRLTAAPPHSGSHRIACLRRRAADRISLSGRKHARCLEPERHTSSSTVMTGRRLEHVGCVLGHAARTARRCPAPSRRR